MSQLPGGCLLERFSQLTELVFVPFVPSVASVVEEVSMWLSFVEADVSFASCLLLVATACLDGEADYCAVVFGQTLEDLGSVAALCPDCNLRVVFLAQFLPEVCVEPSEKHVAFWRYYVYIA